MKKDTKIDPRIPADVGRGALPDYPAFCTPWGKLISFKEIYKYGQRHKAIIGSGFMQALRIMIPDYETRVQRMCEVECPRYSIAMAPPIHKFAAEGHNVHPFISGGNIGGFFGDAGDECFMQCGRINDYGTYRLEKELDTCVGDFIGTECCRCSVMTLQEIANLYGDEKLEYHMVEAKAYGDLHCRIVAESRKKYPMPENEGKPLWDFVGPVATADQIKFTPEEKMYNDTQVLRDDCDYHYHGPTCEEYDATYAFKFSKSEWLNSQYVCCLLDVMLENKEVERDYVENIIKCVFEGYGKAMFGDFYAIKGVREWLGVPADINDGRVLGALIETILTSRVIDYTVQAFNEKEVIYDIKREDLLFSFFDTAFISMWFGMSKTLINAMWAVWEEKEGVPEDVFRIKIGKKRDLFC